MFALDVPRFEISGGPDWLYKDRYDVIGVPPSSSSASALNPPSPNFPLSKEQREMLLSLLISRFRMKIHQEIKTAPVFILTKSGKRINLHPALDTSLAPWVGSNGGAAINGDGIAGKNISMQLFASRLSQYAQRPVLDETGLAGSFDFSYEYERSEQNEDLMTSILTSVEALGLKLKDGKGPVDTVIVDRIERPSPN